MRTYWLSVLAVVLALAALLCLPMAAVAEEAVGTDEAFIAAMNRYRLENAVEFDITLTASYFSEVKENSFARFHLLALKSGMADQQLRYYEDGRLMFSQVRWQVPHVAECASEKEVEDAIAGFLKEKAAAFQLICPASLANSLQSSYHLYMYMGQNGVEDFDLRYTSSFPRVYYFEEIKLSTLPSAMVKDEDGFLSAIYTMFQENADHFCLLLEPDFFKALQNDRERLDLLEASSQLEKWSLRRDTYYRRYEYEGVTYSAEPRVLCETEEDIQQAVREMGAAGITDFRLVLTRTLHDQVKGNQFARLQALTSDAGMSSSDFRYSIGGTTIYYSGAVIRADVTRLTTPEEAMAYTAEQAAAGEREISLFCSGSLYKTLIGNISSMALLNDSMAPLYDVTAQAGIFQYTFNYSAATNVITLHVSDFYPGFHIVYALLRGEEDALPARERETLAAARQVVNSCRRGNPLDTARALHDWLCENNVYTDDDRTDEDDTAIGAILNGQANCDGYADAFYLLGQLAGLNVRYQHGDSYNVGLSMDLFSQVTHMWNLLEIDDTWRLVDVTWDYRDEEGIRYTWFNLGEDRARRMHIWNAVTSVDLLPYTDLNTRPDNEYFIGRGQTVEEAVQQALADGHADFELVYLDADSTPSTGDSIILNALRSLMPGSFRYSWNERMLTMTVYR